MATETAGRGYWSETRLNGQPLQPGTVCWVTEVPGQNPIATYGKSAQDVIEKLSLTNAYAQAELARKATPTTEPVVTEIVPARRRLTADEIAQRTSDLANPAKAGEAVVALFADATGTDPRQAALDRYAAMAMAWQRSNPAFYDHPGNKRLLTEQARSLVGGDLTMVTPEILTQAYNILRTRGELIFAPVAVAPNPSDPQPASSSSQNPSLPGESRVQPTERQRGTPFVTQPRSTSYRGTQTMPTKTPKYTKEEILAMPLDKSRALCNPAHPDHKAYNEACEFHFAKAEATA